MANDSKESRKVKDSGFVLGVDLGTTSVKVALIDVRTQAVVRTKSRDTNAYIHCELHNSCQNEQDVSKILSALQFCVSGLPKEELRQVIKIGVSGQMHGVVLWKQNHGWCQKNQRGRYEVGDVCSNVYTWQDGRCDSNFIAALPEPNSHLKLASGFGCCTIFWLLRNEPEFLKKFDRAGTIQDYVVALLCDMDKPVMTVHNAASWGYFNTVTKTWNSSLLEKAGFPVSVLPNVVDAGCIVGSLSRTWYDLSTATPVSAAMGDLQCSFLSRSPTAHDAVLNISTSAQLGFQMTENFTPSQHKSTTSTVDYFPYFNNRYLAVAASLTGGNVMYGFVKLLQQWTHELGLGVPESKIWERMNALGMDFKEDTDLVISPTIYGERHNPGLKGSVSNITPSNTSLGSVCSALSKGIITNLQEMMSSAELRNAGVNRIIGTGTGLVKNSILQKEVVNAYNIPMLLSNDTNADAAVGAGLAMCAF